MQKTMTAGRHIIILLATAFTIIHRITNHQPCFYTLGLIPPSLQWQRNNNI
jgi:hypothetical protein